jgi:carbon monoxide dehydrogenase subunit G
MKIEGTFRVAAPRVEVWRKITDPVLMVGCIPGCNGIEVLSPNRYAAKIRIGIGPIKANFNLEVEVISEEQPAKLVARTRGEEGSRASSVSAESLLSLAEIDGSNTEVSYSSELSVTGRLGKFGLGVMKKKAHALGEEFASNFRGKIEAHAVGGDMPWSAHS